MLTVIALVFITIGEDDEKMFTDLAPLLKYTITNHEQAEVKAAVRTISLFWFNALGVFFLTRSLTTFCIRHSVSIVLEQRASSHQHLNPLTFPPTSCSTSFPKLPSLGALP